MEFLEVLGPLTPELLEQKGVLRLLSLMFSYFRIVLNGGGGVGAPMTLLPLTTEGVCNG